MKTPTEEKLANIAEAVRAVIASASTMPLADCLSHAQAAQHLIEREGFTSRIVYGFSAWRVHGEDPGAVVAHYNGEGCETVPGGSLVFHSWIEIGGENGSIVFDPTTYQLRDKMSLIDQSDGGRTRVSWAPEFLAMKLEETRSWEDVRDGNRAGLVMYEERPDFARITEGLGTLEDIHRTALEWALQTLEEGLCLRIFGPQGQYRKRA